MITTANKLNIVTWTFSLFSVLILLLVVLHDPELAQVLEGIKVVQISDIHLQGGIGDRERDLIAQVNALKPDLLFNRPEITLLAIRK